MWAILPEKDSTNSPTSNASGSRQGNIAVTSLPSLLLFDVENDYFDTLDSKITSVSVSSKLKSSLI